MRRTPAAEDVAERDDERVNAEAPRHPAATSRPPHARGSEPPRVAYEDQDLGEIAGADRAAGRDHLSRGQALGHSDRGAERERARAASERHAGIDEHDIAGPPEAVAPADQVV